ncbi:hypothetical protein AE1304_39620 [Aeromonas enteropelogenes]
MVTADDYASLIDPTLKSLPPLTVATAPDCRYQIAPLTIDLGKGVNRRPSPYYGARVVLSMILVS